MCHAGLLGMRPNLVSFYSLISEQSEHARKLRLDFRPAAMISMIQHNALLLISQARGLTSYYYFAFPGLIRLVTSYMNIPMCPRILANSWAGPILSEPKFTVQIKLTNPATYQLMCMRTRSRFTCQQFKLGRHGHRGKVARPLKCVSIPSRIYIQTQGLPDHNECFGFACIFAGRIFSFVFISNGNSSSEGPRGCD